MKGALDPDHDLLGEDEPPRDLVLGAPALVGIFVAVVLVCAVCFGFGYSSSHSFHLPSLSPTQSGAAAPASGPASGTAGTTQLAKPTPGGVEPAESAGAADNKQDALPHPDAPPSASEPAPVLSAGGVPIAKPAPGVASSAEAVAAQPVEATPRQSVAETPRAAAPEQVREVAPRTTASPAAAESAPARAAIPAGHLALMVQIAAVSRSSDAATLTRALRRRGFDPVVRTSRGDAYFHVQVGPFANYDEARAARSRLAADGYTAFIRR